MLLVEISKWFLAGVTQLIIVIIPVAWTTSQECVSSKLGNDKIINKFKADVVLTVRSNRFEQPLQQLGFHLTGDSEQ